MRFLVDRCAGRILADWLKSQGHDVFDASELADDPGDDMLLSRAVAERRIVITMDQDFGTLVFRDRLPHAGMIRLPDVRNRQRVSLVKDVVDRFAAELEGHAIIVIQGDKLRLIRSP